MKGACMQNINLLTPKPLNTVTCISFLPSYPHSWYQKFILEPWAYQTNTLPHELHPLPPGSLLGCPYWMRICDLPAQPHKCQDNNYVTSPHPALFHFFMVLGNEFCVCQVSTPPLGYTYTLCNIILVDEDFFKN